MIRYIFTLLIISSQATFGQIYQKDCRSAFTFVDSILKKDNYAVELLEIDYPKDIQQIILKFQRNMIEKKEWFEYYFSKNYKEGEGLPYDENFGITKDEYRKIKEIQKTPPLVAVQSISSIKPKYDSNVLTFKAIDQNAAFFEFIRIDFKMQRLFFMTDTIPFSDEINATSTPFGQWHGYSWKKEISNLGENDELKTDSLATKIVEISFGKVISNDKILFHLKYKELDRGNIKANFDVNCYLN